MSQFVEQISSEAMLTRFAEMCEERPDIRVLRYILNEPKSVLEWVHSVGVLDDELSSLVPLFPPKELRKLGAAEDLEVFLWTGLVDLERIMTLYGRNKSPADPIRPTILDFGCGCGRMTRFLNDYTKLWSTYACDVAASHVNWCKDNLKGISTAQNTLQPPSPYQDQMFNLIYGLSVFTHLSEESVNQWLSEFYRILAPNGLLIMSTHGFPALDIIKDSKVHQGMFHLSTNDVIDIIANLKEKLFIFRVWDTLHPALPGDEYGDTFIHPNYVYDNWENEQYKVLQHIPGGLRGWQDIVILQRR